MTATLWMELAVAPEFTVSVDELWTVTRPFDHLPEPGDEVILWPGEDFDPMAGTMWPVKKRYWDARGHAHLELAKMVVDPTDDYLRGMHDRGMACVMRNEVAPERSWTVRYDGDPRHLLERGFWENVSGR